MTVAPVAPAASTSATTTLTEHLALGQAIAGFALMALLLVAWLISAFAAALPIALLALMTALSGLLTLWLVRQGQEQRGQLLLVGEVFVALLIGTYFIGPFTAGVSLLLWPILLSSFFFGVAGATISTVIAVLMHAGAVYLVRQEVYTPAFPLDNSLDLFNIVFFAATSVLVAIAIVAYQRHLAHAYDSLQSHTLTHAQFQAQMSQQAMATAGMSEQMQRLALNLHQSAGEQASSAAEQAAVVAEISTTMEELGRTAEQIAENSDSVAHLAERTLDAAEKGRTSVHEMVNAMEGVREQIQSLAGRMLSLGQQSQQIGQIIDMITDIADETHLLALNAAIEAAGAGEHGRRFSVVAGEVKKLANRAMQAAAEVRQVIGEIQAATNASVLATEQGVKQTDRGAEVAQRAGQSIDVIVVLAEETTQATRQISLATQQQRSASDQVIASIRDLADVARQTADAANATAGTAEEINQLATASPWQTNGAVAGVP